MAHNPGVEALTLVRLQLLANLGRILDNLTEAGQPTLAEWLSQRLEELTDTQLSEWDQIDYITASLSYVYQMTTEQERPLVFRGYRRAVIPAYAWVYAPKTEVHYFCQEVEPRILQASGKDAGRD